ncbi:MAG: carbonic anhydrase family protein, partial [Polyangiales bacterium]
MSAANRFNRARTALAAWLIIPLIGTGCGSDTDAPVTGESESPLLETWGYSGTAGPDHWSQLDASYQACGHPVMQTPIDFPAASTPGLQEAVVTDYRLSTLQTVNTGHTVQVNYDPGSYLTLGGTEYELVQFHFHSHSEHSVGGRV